MLHTHLCRRALARYFERGQHGGDHRLLPVTEPVRSGGKIGWHSPSLGRSETVLFLHLDTGSHLLAEPGKMLIHLGRTRVKKKRIKSPHFTLKVEASNLLCKRKSIPEDV